MNLDELLNELLKLPAADVVTAIKAKANTIYQPIFNDGHSVATAALRQKTADLETKLQTATAEKAQVAGELQEFKTKNPGATELHQQYADKLAAKDQEIERLKTEFKTSEQSSRRNTVLGKIRESLKVRVDADKADAIVDRKELQDRVQIDDQNTVRVMQTGLSIPFAGDVDAQVASIVEEIVKTVPEKLLRSDVSAGSGRESTVAGSGGGTPKAKLFESIRKSVTPGAEADPNQLSNEDKLRVRFGGRRAL